ncbi:MAG: HlyU family transcriptional regulator [Pseudomonadota bacterium]
MGLLGSLKSLFGGGSDDTRRPGAEPVEYNGFEIEPAPAQKAGGWNTAGFIRKSIDGEIKEQSFIRVDTHSSRDDAIAFSITKAQQIIDEQGENLFRSKR